MIHVQQVKEENLMDREVFTNKRSKTTWNECGQQNSYVNGSSFQEEQKGPTPSTTSTYGPGNRGEFQN